MTFQELKSVTFSRDTGSRFEIRTYSHAGIAVYFRSQHELEGSFSRAIDNLLLAYTGYCQLSFSVVLCRSVCVAAGTGTTKRNTLATMSHRFERHIHDLSYVKIKYKSFRKSCYFIENILLFHSAEIIKWLKYMDIVSNHVGSSHRYRI
jgi:hypothetical protein